MSIIELKKQRIQNRITVSKYNMNILETKATLIHLTHLTMTTHSLGFARVCQ